MSMFIKRLVIPIMIFVVLFTSTHFVFAQTSEEDRARLYSELQALEKEIAQKEAQLNEQRKQSGTIKKDVDLLTSQINLAKTKIKSKNLLIDKLSKEINSRTKTIGVLEDKLDISKDSLTQLLKKTNDLSQENVVYMLLSNESVSDFYQDLDSFASLKKSVKSAVDSIKIVKADTEEEKKNLQDNKDDQVDAKVLLEGQKKQVEKSESEKKKLLAISKDKESAYQKEVAERQKRVTEIKARLFNLAGGSQAIRFDVALGYAEEASRSTGVDPAFVLAILTQESRLGANVGKCFLTDTTTGAGISTGGKVWPNLMKPTRDVKPFLNIVSSLGFDWSKTAVSCPIAGVAGYGGAMGPAQFIPSTWQIFDEKVKAITGSANPWSARDAFTASALYLTQLGARQGSSTSEIKAACKYYGTGGSNCSYGRSVMKLKDSIQADINYLKQYGVSKR